MQYASYETTLLGEISDEYYLAAQCRDCKHGRRMSIKGLQQRLGTDFLVVQIRKRLRCERCGSIKIVVSFFNPGQHTGNLNHLFNEPGKKLG